MASILYVSYDIDANKDSFDIEVLQILFYMSYLNYIIYVYNYVYISILVTSSLCSLLINIIYICYYNIYVTTKTKCIYYKHYNFFSFIYNIKDMVKFKSSFQV